MKILGFNYKVIGSSDSQYIGFHSADTLTIKIDRDAPLDRKLETILHECMEAINTHTQLGLRHNKITTIANIMYQILKDNGIDLSPLLRGVK